MVSGGGQQRPLRQLTRLAIGQGWQRYIVTPACTAWTRLQLWWCGAKVGGGLRVSGCVQLRVSGELRIGAGVRINSGYVNFVGGERRMAIWVGRGAKAVIGDRCRLSNSTLIACSDVEILEETFIGGGCDIYDSDIHALDSAARLADAPAPCAPVRIGPRAFVGGRVTVLKGVTIGEGAVIGAGSVVTNSVPAGEIWAGVPARMVGKVKAEQ